jgi:hypothetical protein
VVEVAPRVGDPSVRPRHLDAGLLPALTSLLLAGQVLLHPLQLLLRAAQEFGAGDLGAVVHDREMHKAEVDGALGVGLRKRLGSDLDHERREEPTSRVVG